MDRLRLHQELYLLGHDDAGRLRTHLPALRLGLAGAVLLELVLTERLHLSAGQLVVYDPTPHGDSVTDTVVAAIVADRGQQDRDLRVWLRRLAIDADERTRGGMVAAGLLTRVTCRRLGIISSTRYEPTSEAPTVIARAALWYAVHGRQQPDPQCTALCALLAVLQLQSTLYLDLPGADVLRRLREIGLLQPRAAHEILAAVEAMIRDLAVVVYR
jgi:hypothetical protein